MFFGEVERTGCCLQTIDMGPFTLERVRTPIRPSVSCRIPLPGAQPRRRGHAELCSLHRPPCNGLTADFRDLYSEFQTNRFFDQLISEKEISPGIPSWMHVGYEGPGGEQRRQFFVL